MLTGLLSWSNGFIEAVHRDPQHPHTERLLASVPGGPGFTLDYPPPYKHRSKMARPGAGILRRNGPVVVPLGQLPGFLKNAPVRVLRSRMIRTLQQP